MNEFPLLAKEDEELQMMLEVAEEFTKQKQERTARKKSGNATEIVIRKHLLKRRFNLTLIPDVRIQGSDIKNDLLLLKPSVDPNEEKYAPNSIHMVIEVKNNATPVKAKRKGDPPIQPSQVIKDNFNELEREANVKRFAVIVLSEKLLSETVYKYAITEEKIGKENCKVFTLIARREYPQYPKYPKGGLYLKEVVLEMLKNGELWKTGDMDRLFEYLKS